MTFVRVFVNQDTTLMYRILFEKVFGLIKERTGREVRWRHLYRDSYADIIIDIDLKLAIGILYFYFISKIILIYYKRIWKVSRIY